MIVALFALVAHATMVDRVAAVVGSEPIALSELYDLGGDYIAQKCPGQTTGTCVHDAEKEVLDAIVERVLVRQALAKLDLDVTGEEVDRGIDAMVKQYNLATRDDLRREFEGQGVAWDVVREQVADEIRMLKFNENVIKPRITVSDIDVEDLYQRMVRDVGATNEFELEAFAVAAPADATERAALIAKLTGLVGEINGGTRDWLATVKELDISGLAAADGKMGKFKDADLAPALKSAVLATAEGKVAPPIDVGKVIYVIKVARSAQAGVKTLEEVRPQLVEQVYAKKGEGELQTWYVQAKKDASIRVLLDETP